MAKIKGWKKISGGHLNNLHEWQQSFKIDIKEKLKYSEKEYNEYKNTGYIIYLQQAGNKLFSVVENWLMLKYNKRVRSYKALLMNIDKNDKILLTQASQLHYFFYNGDLQMSKEEAEIIYENMLSKMKNRVK